MFPTNKSPKISYKFVCESCNYKCNKQSEINKHNSTRKHKNLQNPTLETTSKSHICKCGNVYKHSSTFYTHRKKCEFTSSITTSPPQQPANSNTDNSELVEKMFTMFTQMMTPH